MALPVPSPPPMRYGRGHTATRYSEGDTALPVPSPPPSVETIA
jgi:hypothetical protein